MNKLFQRPNCVLPGRFPGALRGGFTLVENVVAIGITAFALTGIVGLLGMAQRGTKDADTDARLALISRRVAATCQSQPFSTFASGSTAVSGTTYYDYSGTPMASDSAVSSGTYFQCVVQDAGPALSGTHELEYARQLQLQIRWPHPAYSESDVSVISVLNTK